MSNDNEAMMAWLESSLEHARDRHQPRLRGLLESVRAEVVFEADLAKRRGRLTERSPLAPSPPYDSGRRAATVRPERAL